MNQIQSQEAEHGVLGGLMLDKDGLGDVLDVISTGDFASHANRLIFDVMLRLDERGEAFDEINVAIELERMGEIESIGDMAYLGSLSRNTPSAANIKSYARIVREKSLERRLAHAATEIMDLAHGGDISPQEKIDKAGSIIMELSDTKTSSGPVLVRDSMREWLAALDERFQNGGELVGLSTGYVDLDAKLNGLNDSDLIIVAGRPAMGKSTFAVNLAEHAALNGTPAAIFSLEMPRVQLINRMVSSVGRISHESIRTGQINHDDWDRVTIASGKVNSAPLHIDDTPALSIADLRSRSRRLKKQNNIGLIVVDYLQLMKAPGAENRTNEISTITMGLKQIAKELNVPVVALSQLNRGLENRTDKRPVMSDLRESGSIEQDADIIIMLYRDEVYNEETPDKGQAEVIIRKQRNGEIGTVRLAFNGAFSRFDDLTHYRGYADD